MLTMVGAEGQEEPEQQLAMVVDGATLRYLLDEDLRMDFLEVAAKCRSVICCRTTPLQKVSWREIRSLIWKVPTNMRIV